MFDTDAVLNRARRWLESAGASRPTRGDRVLERALATPGGLGFLTQAVDGIVRPDDARVAARAMRRLGGQAGEYLPWHLAQGLRLGGLVGAALPGPIVSTARRTVRSLVGHLVVDARPGPRVAALRRLARQGYDANVNLLGEAVLGIEEADRRLVALGELIEAPEVDYVSVKVSAAVAPHSHWDVDGAVDSIVARLRPLYVIAARHGTFINLDMEEYRDLEVTLEVFARLVRDPELLHRPWGVVLQAYLPDSAAALTRMQELARERERRGGVGLRVRIVKGANLPMERVESELRGWPLATWHSKAETDAQYKRLLACALEPDSAAVLHVGVAGHNVFDLAYAWELAVARGVTDSVQVEMLLGLASGLREAIARDVGRIRLYTPAVDPRDFDVALAYLVRRLEEVANPGNFLAHAQELIDRPSGDHGQWARFRESAERATRPPATASHRIGAARTSDTGTALAAENFRNTPDADPANPQARARMLAALARAASSHVGIATADSASCTDATALDAVVGRARAAGEQWSRACVADRARLLRAMASRLERSRELLVEVMASETGKTVDQADPEVSEAVDFALYYAARAEDLDSVSGATPVPRPLTLVAPPWNFPVAIPAGSTLAALAAGSAVVLKPATEARRCGAVLTEVLHHACDDAGVSRDTVTLVDLDPAQLGDRLIADERIDQVILTGAYETAQHLLDVRPGLRLFAETSGKNAMIITPSADYELAARDLVASAFGHAGQKCSAASLAILVGSAGTSARLKRLILDAARALTVGVATDPATQMGPVIAPPEGKLLRALTALDHGEEWWLKPKSVGAALWTPGIRAGVTPGSFFHRTECFGPVLGIMVADSLDQALTLVEGIDYGLTAGLHSLDTEEIHTWLDRVPCGNLYVNRATTGAIVRRQPFGGWRRSTVGATVKAGGPHYVASLCGWVRADAPGTSVISSPPHGQALRALGEQARGPWVAEAIAADAQAWEDVFRRGHDPSGLAAELNVLRYVPAPTLVRWDGVDVDDALRVCAAMVRAGTSRVLSADRAPATSVCGALERAGVVVEVEPDSAALERVVTRHEGRVRMVGAVAPLWRGNAQLYVYDGDVTAAPERELIPFVREQAVSVTAHRYGAPWRPASRLRASLLAPR